MNNKIIKTFFILGIIIIVGLETLCLWGLPAILNYAIKSQIIHTIIENSTGLITEINDFNCKTTPNFNLTIQIKDIILKHKNNIVFKVENFKTKVYLPSFILKKISIQQVDAKSIYSNFSKDKDKNFLLGNFKIDLNTLKNGHKNVSIKKANIKKIDIIINDEIIEKKHKIKIEETDFIFIKNQVLKLKTNAYIQNKNEISSKIFTDFYINLKTNTCLQQNCSIKIQNIDIKDYKEHIKDIYGHELRLVNGKINAELKNIPNNKFQLNTEIAKLQILTQNPLDTIKSNGNINIDGIFMIKDKNINIEQATISSQDWKLNIDGEIKKYLSNKYQNDLKIKFINSNINSLYWLVPTNLNDKFETIRKIKKHGFGGISNGEIRLKGTLDKPEVYGDLKILECYIAKDNPNIPKFNINIEFLKDNAKIKTRIFTSNKEYVDVKGITELKPIAKGKFEIESTKNVDLETVSYMLIPLHDIIGFDIGPIPYMKIKGIGNIILKTEGTVIDGNAYGQFNFKNTNASIQGLNTELNKVDGNLKFEGRNLYFETTNANIKNSKLKITGEANLNGNIKFYVSTNDADTSTFFDIIKTSHILKKQKRLINKISKIEGIANANITIKGNVKDYGEILEKNTLDIAGELILKNCNSKVVGLPILIKNLCGQIKFQDTNWNANLNGKLENSLFTIIGKNYNDTSEIKLIAPELDTDKIIQNFLPNNKTTNIPKTNSLISLNATYQGSYENINLNNLKAKGQIKTKNKEKSEIDIQTGIFELNKGLLQIKNFKANFFDAQISTKFQINNLFTPNFKINGNLQVTNFEIDKLAQITKLNIIPIQVKNLINTYENYKGKTDIDVVCINNQLKGKLILKNINFNHKYFKTPINIDSGEIILDGEKATLNSVIANIDDIPIFTNLSIWDLDKNAKLNGYLTTKINENFINKYINSKLTSPLKIKGDITITSDIKGNLNNLKIYPKIKFAKDSDIYYKGSNLGNEEDEREILATIELLDNNSYAIKKLNYTRYMTSQNDKSYPLTIITADGKIKLERNKLHIDNFNIETQNKANAKLLNILFQKSIIKNGLFTCKLNIKGNIQEPKIQGNLDIENIDIPLYTMFVEKFSVDFKEKHTNLTTNGIVLNTDFIAKATIKNNIKKPIIIENIELQSQKVNLDKLIDYITQIPTPSNLKFVNKPQEKNNPLTISDIRINNGLLKANDILIKDINAKNLKTEFNLDDKMILQIPKLQLEITTGNINGTATYEFESGKIKTNLTAFNVDSNKIASSLFEFKDQIFGYSNGNVAMTTKGNTEEERLKNMTGYVYFEIIDGKMPKLGSIEYLLKAGNLFKSGITGLSINKIIEVLSPIKTGEFESIKGSFDIKNGVAQNLEVYSKSNNLNLFMNGEYDIIHQYANMRVYGRLVQKSNNMLGKIGNLSINSIISQLPGLKLNEKENSNILKDLNKIPGVEFENEQYRNFTVKIDGDINEDKYVKNFRWIE